jgi:hypothetical protein
VTSRARRIPLALVALLGLVVPLLGLAPAHGAGVPVIVTPVDGESYYVGETPDLHLDFSDAPYGDYRFELTDAPEHVILAADIEHSGSVDPDAFYELPELGLGEYTVTVFGAAGAVLATSTFGTFSLGEPPLLCGITVPSKVVATAPYTAVYPKFTGCGDSTALWSVTRKIGGATTGLGFLGIQDGASRGAWRFRDSYPTGRYDVRPTGDLQNTTSTVIKFGSQLSLAGTRASRTRVPLSGVARRYVPSADAFKAWGSRPVAISYKDCAGCPWKFLAMDTTDSAGRWGLTVISTRVRYYRAAVGETTTAWGRTSQPVRR